MKRKEIEADQMPGQDSFLDVITNIVGILILLVLVVGLRTSRAVQASADPPTVELTSDVELEDARGEAAIAERGIRDLVNRFGNARQEVAFREQERNYLTTVVTVAEQKIAEHRSNLSTNDQRDFDLRRQLAETQAALDERTREQVALLSREAPTEEIKCEPTPLAKRVTGKEVHVLLADDHVAVVPLTELMNMVKDDVTANVWRLRQQDEMERTIGPINGFRLKYWFVKEKVIGQSDAGMVVAGTIPTFSHCCVLPVVNPAGEPAAEAMQPSSEFSQALRGLRPEGTTITIWTYPGNYERLRELKRSIRQMGFQIAVRPLPQGMPIGASRHGTDSLSE